MMSISTIKRLYVRKKDTYAVEAKNLTHELRVNYGLANLDGVQILNRYDVDGLNDEMWQQSLWTVFAEKALDLIAEEDYDFSSADYLLAVEDLPGQYSQREDSAEQAVEILTAGIKPKVRCARVYLFNGEFTETDRELIYKHLINPVEAREAKLEKPSQLEAASFEVEDVEILTDFNDLDEAALLSFREAYGLAMPLADLVLAQSYFRSVYRDPSITEIRVLDTYWSDHCRHTTFNTELAELALAKPYDEEESVAFAKQIEKSLDRYHELRESIHGPRLAEKPRTLMDLATIGMKEIKRQGLLEDLDASEEINACSIEVTVPTADGDEVYLIMFKNETHNHPTEIEPFGGAATCLGGAIRDPLSGRSYVYQAMRVTGSANPLQDFKETIPGKLSQRTITTTAAAGYSSYGNQIGLATGQVAEVYHPGYVAKRMEIGAVVAATPKSNVIRQVPEAGDRVILLGGRTGRDGVGGATGSSKKHDESSLEKSGSEVQKGNPLTERNLQRFFRNPEAARMIRRCNDFGAGGVAVAIGELADGLMINLDAVPKKYEGLDGTELAISESQERMACVVRASDVEQFIDLAAAENLEATEVAEVTAEAKLQMSWRGKTIVDLDRSFLDTNGADSQANAVIGAVSFADRQIENVESFDEGLRARLSDLRFASQKGLVERFDATVGANTVLYPLGGKRQLTPEEGMAARIPLRQGETQLSTMMAYGFDPYLSDWSPYHGAYYAVIESIAKLVAMGASPEKIRLTFQEYFPSTSTAEKWGLPLAALLGALDAQLDFKTPSIGGKDSMSGTFESIDVPATLVSFAIATCSAEEIHSATLTQAGRSLYLLDLPKDELGLVRSEDYLAILRLVHRLHQRKAVEATATAKAQGVATTVAQMCFGNELGFAFDEQLTLERLFKPAHAALIVELSDDLNKEASIQELEEYGAIYLGQTSSTQVMSYQTSSIPMEELLDTWQHTLEPVFPTKSVLEETVEAVPTLSYLDAGEITAPAALQLDKPLVVIPVFPGTNCDYDSERAWLKAGARVRFVNIRNMTAEALRASLDELVEAIDEAQVIMLAGGFSAGDEPDGSAKFISIVFRNPAVKAAVERLHDVRGGLILGICNGFQALIKLGLLPYGKITDQTEDSPTLTYNNFGRHQSIYIQTRIASVKSPWLSNCSINDLHSLAISHGEGRLIADRESLNRMAESGQIVAQYVDPSGQPTMEEPYNPNGSAWAIEAICSPDGRILGKMAHSERVGESLVKNIPGEKDQRLFEAAVAYFTGKHK